MSRHDRQTSFDFELREPIITPAPSGERLVSSLPPAPAPASRRITLERALAGLVKQRVALVVTDNGHTMISSKTDRGGLRVRVHHMFLHADEPTVRALARYLTSRNRRAVAHLDNYIEENGHLIRRRRRMSRIEARGSHHDLSEMFDYVNRRWFDGRVTCTVTWGRRPTASRRKRRSIRLGTYDGTDAVIRIHPALDADWVPEFFITFVLYHEMLHHVVPAPVKNGRKRYHTAEFRRLERAHPDYERAVVWEKDNLSRLLRS